MIYLQQTRLLTIKSLLNVEDIRLSKVGERIFKPETICNIHTILNLSLSLIEKDTEDKFIFRGVIDLLYLLTDIRKSLESVVPLSFNIEIIYKVYKDQLLLKLRDEVSNAHSINPQAFNKYKNEAHFINCFFNDKEFEL